MSLRASMLCCALAVSFPAAAQNFLGNYTGHSSDSNLVTIHAGASVVTVQTYAPHMVKVRLQYYGPQSEEFSYMVAAPPDSLAALDVHDDSLALRIQAASLDIVCQKYPLRLSFYAHGSLLTQEKAAGGMGWDGAPLLYLRLAADEHIYGSGQRATGLDLRGRRFDTYNRANFGYDGPEATMNINIPFVLSNRGYGILFDNSYPATFDVGRADPGALVYAADGGNLTFYLMAGSSMKEVLERYTYLTGRQPLPPRWALGYLQSKYGYRDEPEARQVVNTLRARGFPLDALILDLYWCGLPAQMGALEWDRSRFPNAEQMMADFKQLGVQTILIHEPYFMRGLRNFDEANAQALFGKGTSGQTLTFGFWTGVDAALLDLSLPAARAWLWSKLQPLIDGGVRGWWTDLGEPELHPDGMTHHLGSAAKVHNLFNLLWSKAIFEAYQQHYPDTRLFNLTRSGTAGLQRYSTFPWSGDVRRSFSGLAVQLPIMLGMGLSGAAYQHSDLGGFTGGDMSTQPELYARWMQFGAFSPITRAHGVDALPTEPYQFGEQVENICRDYLRLRHRLLPYNYTYAHENSQSGLPLARPLILEYPDDPNATNLSAEYLWGEWMLVAPVVRTRTQTSNVYLPSGEWIDFWTKQTYSGNTTVTVDAPLERLPLFVKRGAIIPMQEWRATPASGAAATPDTLALDIYPAGSASFALYEDDGRTLAYRRGQFATTTFDCQANDREISVLLGRSLGDYDGKPSHRLYALRVERVEARPDSIQDGTQRLAAVSGPEELETAGEGWWYDAAQKALVMQKRVATTDEHVLKVHGRGLLTSVTQVSRNVEGFLLRQNFPNPFNPRTTIRFRLPQAGHVSLRLYNSIGDEVAVLVDRTLAAGEHEVQWLNAASAAGLYFCRMQAGDYQATIKVLLVK